MTTITVKEEKLVVEGSGEAFKCWDALSDKRKNSAALRAIKDTGRTVSEGQSFVRYIRGVIYIETPQEKSTRETANKIARLAALDDMRYE